MKRVDITNHKFDKVNLVSLKQGWDKYKCSICGCEGIRKGFVDYIIVTEKMYLKAEKCTHKRDIPKQVVITNIPGLSMQEGIYDVVKCPEEHEREFKNDIWIWSKERGEPVRILSNEIRKTIY
jgi:hypothetical protein